jgi:hypothetical protein
MEETNPTVLAPLLNEQGRRIGWVPTRLSRITLEQREYMRRLRMQNRQPKEVQS